MSQLQTQPQCDGGGTGRPPLGTAVGGGQPSPGRRHPFRPHEETPGGAMTTSRGWWRGLRLELARVSWPSATATVRALGVVASSMVVWAGYLLYMDFVLSRVL
ncbi:preprotein translocase subunit SecE [bacterium]|nr:preprotein translocase subunit SecE [bacterium]